ncbi:isoleucine--tRNA ligase, cytoplasmic-like isoform X2 [Branchiostoma lanceolatum]|uniref:isoleucine--tRNA ligase, cytoplasmic-like isoform X2 n=1 Tax=Branchiostoma lanceolatum TaxID=7740 RepID=UPI003452EBBA
MVEPIPERIDFPGAEEEVLMLWKQLNAFQTSLKQSKGKPRYSFYDGPPFATGLPHYGHILAGTIKDIVTRWAHQSGFHVERRFGWDCHGLPVEYEIDKTLGIKGPGDVASMGIDKYNEACRGIVMRYAGEWKDVVTRLGRWIDFDRDYKTLYPWFMESIWWVFRQLYDKGLVYQGFKVMPYSTACSTPLSNFESNQNYKDVQDPAVIVNFPLDEDPDVSMIAWTTTPWTLPSNMALCVNPQLDYVKVKDNTTNQVYIMMEARLEALFKKPEEYTILDRFKGSTLFGKGYKPLFPYFSERKKSGAFRIFVDGYVTTETGTGVVHQAPYFGEDDYRVCLANGVISRDGTVVCPVDASGCFTEEVTDFKGQYVKEADKNIIQWLKQHGRLVNQGTYVHSYPFCWRSETPLIYKAVPGWFVRVEPLVEKLLDNNSQCYWVPAFVKEKRFANWLRDAHDWAISRNRYWGTPIPLWVSDDYEEVVVVGSVEELYRLSGVRVTDLHRESVDHVTIPSTRGKGVLKRVTEVFDCWFESGSMPYAQNHYPFESKKEFEDSFPADFIAEGIDQTRGWFYTLLVLSTALFGKPPFKNLIVNGLVQAADGQKMSKRKKNYPDPMAVVHKYGADALRLYLINSPVVRADSLRFKEEGVRDVLKDVFLPWYNAYRFLIQNVIRLEKEDGLTFVYNADTVVSSDNIMDRWILSFTQSLIQFVTQEMAAYRLYTVVPRLVKFVDMLTNWYVRFNRKRLKGDGGTEDCLQALETLFSVLFSMTQVMAPFIPFLTEQMYQNLRHLLDPSLTKKHNVDSVHYLMLPKPREKLIDQQIERSVSRMQSVIEVSRVIRDRKTIPVKYPLKELVVIQQDQQCLDDVQSLESYILEELNVRTLTTSSDKQKYCVKLVAEPDHRVLGARLKQAYKSVQKAIRELTDQQLQEFQEKGEIDVEGHTLSRDDLKLVYKFDAKSGMSLFEYEAHSDNQALVLLDVTPDQSMLDEGVAREVINRIQKLRKKASLVPTDDITVYYDVSPASDNLARVIQTHHGYIQDTLKKDLWPFPAPATGDVIIKESAKLKDATLHMAIVWREGGMPTSASSDGPFCKYLNVQLLGLQPKGGAKGRQGTILLENPCGDFSLSYWELLQRVAIIFGLKDADFKLYAPRKEGDVALVTHDMLNGLNPLHGTTIFVSSKQPSAADVSSASVTPDPSCKYVNLQLLGVKPGSLQCGVKGRAATILLENPVGDFHLTREQLVQEACRVFGLHNKIVHLKESPTANQDLKLASNILTMHGSTLYVSQTDGHM